MSTPTTPAQELRGLARAIAEYLDANEMDRASYLAENPQLGDNKSLNLFAAKVGTLDDATAAGYLPFYRKAMEALSQRSGADATTLYEDLSTAKAVRGQTSRLIYSATLARILIIKGETGTGKTSALDIIRDKYNAMSAQQSVFRVDATAAWADRPNNMLGEILTALATDPGARNATKRANRVIDFVNNRGVTTVLQLDEVHDFGVNCLRTLKHIVNKCPIKVQLACHKRLFRTIETEHADDLSQLTGNRLLAIVEMPTPMESDVAIILKRRLPGLTNPELAAKELARQARGNGNLGFVREVIVRAQQRSGKGPITPEALDQFTRAELRARNKAQLSA